MNGEIGMVTTFKKVFPDFKCQMKDDAGEKGKVGGDMHTRTHACNLERGKKLCHCCKKMSAPMIYSKLK